MNVGKRIDEEVAPHLIHELRRRSPCISCHDTASSPRRISSLSKMASTTPNVASRALPILIGRGPVFDEGGAVLAQAHEAPPRPALANSADPFPEGRDLRLHDRRRGVRAQEPRAVGEPLAPGLGPVRDAAGVEVRHQAPPVFALPLVPPPRDVESGQ